MSAIPLRFFGGSDDTFGEYARFGVDHDNCASGESIEWAVVDASGDGVLVSGQYGLHNACWSIAVLPWADREQDSEPAMPPWPMRIERPTDADCSYSPVLVIEAPLGVTMRCLQKSEDDGS